ncbi:MAG: glycosyltransferase family 2 protein [Sulfitobacter sp.]
MTLRDAFRGFKHRRRIAKALSALNTTAPVAKPHGLDTPLVVSLTSYRPRFVNLALTLRCLLRQSMQADKIILWVSAEDAPHLPPQIKELEVAGLTIGICENMRSFTKILPTLRDHPDATIVTADDDVYYADNWLNDLVDGYRITDAKVVCWRAHKMRFAPDGTLLPYTKWHTNIDGPLQSPLLFPTGVSGVLYRPDALDPRVADYNLARSLCPQADDIWLYWMQRMAGTTPCLLSGHTRVIEWELEPTESLRRDNLHKGGNDAQIANMIKRFGLPTK